MRGSTSASTGETPMVRIASISSVSFIVPICAAKALPDRPATYTPREVLTMNLMLQRRGGNLFPDNDRAVTARSVREVTIRCPG